MFVKTSLASSFNNKFTVILLQNSQFCVDGDFTGCVFIACGRRLVAAQNTRGCY